MLHLQIGFPGGRYYAATAADPTLPEWPPHPSRVFSALVAAAYGGGRKPDAIERDALQALEAVRPPFLAFPDADLRPAPDSYVPVNDEKSRINAKKGQSRGVLLPNRQVRQFPAAFILGEPEITLSWPVDMDPDRLRALDGIAARVTHVGTSHALAVARFTSDVIDVEPRWAPDEQGTEFLRVTRSGRLDELDHLAQKGCGTLRRPTPRCEVLVSYRAVGAQTGEIAAPRHDWICLRVGDAAWGAETSHTFARAVRRAVLALAGDAAPPVLHGHDPEIEHVAWLPLPEVGHMHARGRVRGVAIAVPLSASMQDRALVLAALAHLREVRLPDGQVARVEAVIDGSEIPITLRTSTWAATSTHWSTVTPVLLDRPPKRRTPEATLAAVTESLINAGYPVPRSLSVSVTSDFQGAPTAQDVPTRVPRFHARLVFPEPVRGPVLAGRWRNFGIGLFRPTPQELRS